MVRSLSLSVSSSLFPCQRLLHYLEGTWLLEASLGQVGRLRGSSASKHFHPEFLDMLPWQFGTLY